MKPAAKALIYDADNRILVLYRSNTHPRYPLHIDFPGGLVDEGEQAIEAVAREIHEETGLIVSEDRINFVYEKSYPGHPQHLLFTTYIDERQPSINISWEHSSYEWDNVEELLSKDKSKIIDKYFLTVLEYLSNHKS